MTTNLHKEIQFEDEICGHLAANDWLYAEGDAAGYDRVRALFPADVLAWVQETQPKAWEALAKNHGDNAGDTLLARLREQIDQRGTLDVLRQGIEILGLRQPLKLVQFKPALGINPEILSRYAANRHLLHLHDVGLNSLYVADCEALAELAELLGRASEAAELRTRAAAYATRLHELLWNENAGIYQNRRPDTGEFSPRLSPTCFYPALAGAPAERVGRMVHEHLLNPAEFWGEWVKAAPTLSHGPTLPPTPARSGSR